MSRWIDADAFLKEYCEPYPHIYKAMSRAMAEAPSIEIIRCGECKYWKSTVQMPNGTEVKCLYGRKADDFCSYGQKGDENVETD